VGQGRRHRRHHDRNPPRNRVGDGLRGAAIRDVVEADELGRALAVLRGAELTAARRPSVTLASFSREGTR
jgi:hypothetical protein